MNALAKTFAVIQGALSDNANLARVIIFLTALVMLFGHDQVIAWIDNIGGFLASFEIGVEQ